MSNDNLLNSKLELSTYLLIEEAKQRDITVEVIDYKHNWIRLSKDNKIEYIMQASRTSADNYIAPLIMENKVITKKILQENGINTPNGDNFTNYSDAVNSFTRFKSSEIVVKPVTTNFGTGITILNQDFSETEFKSALELAFSHDDTIIIEKFIGGKEYRFLVIGDEVVAILHRIPAHVTGDGNSTIEELITIKNQDVKRGENHSTPFEKIKIDQTVIDYLSKQDLQLSSVLSCGQVVYLRKNSNISTGGESLDFTDTISDEYKNIALAAVKAVGAKISGVDIIIQNIEELPNQNNHTIIELNFNPALYIHTYPFQGKDRKPAAKVLDLLGF